MDVALRVADIVDLFDRFGAEAYDEALPQTDHALQCAALATAEGAPEELVAAALLHDVGHLLVQAQRDSGSAGRAAPHEVAGAAYLRRVFPPAVTAPVALHVSAKRHLCGVDRDYALSLSSGSVVSLGRQGGPMGPAESAAFMARRGASDAVRLRRWDDSAKVVGLRVPGLSAYRSLLERLARPILSSRDHELRGT